MKLIKRWRNNREIYLFTETLKEVNSFLKVVRIYFFFILFSIFFFIDNQNHLDNLYYAVYCWTSWNFLLEPFIMVTYSLFCRSGILKYRSPMVILTSLLSVVNPYMYIKQMSMPPMHKVENETLMRQLTRKKLWNKDDRIILGADSRLNKWYQRQEHNTGTPLWENCDVTIFILLAKYLFSWTR